MTAIQSGSIGGTSAGPEKAVTMSSEEADFDPDAMPASLHEIWNRSEPVAPLGDGAIVFVNGHWLRQSCATVSVLDHGLLYGDGVFEGIRVYNGKVFKCDRHLDRLWKGADALRLRIPLSRSQMMRVVQHSVACNKLVDGYLRVLVTRGRGTLGLDPRTCPVAGVICIAGQITLFPQELYERGMRVIVAHRPVNPLETLDPRVKSLNYLNQVMAKYEGIDFDCHEVIRLNQQGDVCEGSGDNVFIIRDGVVYTPSTDSGLLEGVTREYVIETLCPQLGIPCVIKKISLTELLNADEVFLTGTAAEIIAVTQIDQYDAHTREVRSRDVISSGEGPVTKSLRRLFYENARRD